MYYAMRTFMNYIYSWKKSSYSEWCTSSEDDITIEKVWSQKYDYKLAYVPGMFIYTPHNLQEETMVMVNSLVERLPMRSTKLDQSKRENKSDPKVQAIYTQVQQRAFA